ncbi:MAG: helix-turn-helix transcriptional regulator [Lachnospira sp.]|nr:helix-turn-helix transcriptional regulator [Lachnospira sp.]
MTDFNLGDNIIRLRREKKLTQEDIASFIGVTKASVSKWENKLSMPDITLLPALATLFDVSVDELLGYQPQLNDQQIRDIYIKLEKDFVNYSFEEALAKVTEEVKKYYNCYPFINYMCVLILNHINLVHEPKRQEEVLLQAQSWSDHIRKNCKVTTVVEDAVAVHTMINFLLKRYPEVTETLKESQNPLRMSSSNDMLLIQTFAMTGDLDNAEKYAQSLVYKSVLNILSCSALMLSVQLSDKDWCNETIRRIDGLIESFHLEEVNKNAAIQYFYQAAVAKVLYGEKEEAYRYLNKFVEQGIDLVKHPEQMFTFEQYFNRMEEWTTEYALNDMLPRDKSFIVSDLLAMLNHPVLQELAGETAFKRLKKKLRRKCNYA